MYSPKLKEMYVTVSQDDAVDFLGSSVKLEKAVAAVFESVVVVVDFAVVFVVNIDVVVVSIVVIVVVVIALILPGRRRRAAATAASSVQSIRSAAQRVDFYLSAGERGDQRAPPPGR